MPASDITTYIHENKALMYRTLRELCAIPSPSHAEQQRAAYCKQWLEQAGAADVTIDSACNVILPFNAGESTALTVFAAHTDTVFPDLAPMPYTDDGQRICCPGVGDNTASLTVLLMLTKYYLQFRPPCAGGILFVCNSCEEGLGNLKGTRQLFQTYAGRIRQFISFDSFALNRVATRCVGSHRYEVTVTTPGGHSYSSFGSPNAIAVLAELIHRIYSTPLPKKEGSTVTYNVGSITGGTSVNTIAQSARMLCEYRSDDLQLLAHMEQVFLRIFQRANTDTVTVRAERIGNRPCANIAPGQLQQLSQRLTPVIEAVAGRPVEYTASSTDCNIPLSMGIPAICIGVYNGGGAHTREEWIEKGSLIQGLELAIRGAIQLTEDEI